MRIAYFVFLGLLACIQVQSQTLEIERDGNTKNIALSSVFTIDIDHSPVDSCCVRSSVKCKIIAIEDDSLQLQLFSIGHSQSFNENEIPLVSDSYIRLVQDQKIAKSEVMKIKVSKSIKLAKRNSSFNDFGILFIISGLVSAAQAGLLPDRPSKKWLFRSSLLQLSVGVCTSIFFNDKVYRMKDTDRPWRIK